MIGALDVQKVGRTAVPLKVGQHELNIDWIVRHTTMKDWDGCMYELGATAAMELAGQWNSEHGLFANGRKPRGKINTKAAETAS